MHTHSVLKLENLSIAYETHTGNVEAVRGVSIEIAPGETYGVVGESGCGKSTLAFGIMRYLAVNARVNSGRILFQGEDVLGMAPEQLRSIRGNQIAMVYQDPMAALNPSLRIGHQLTEVLMVHRKMKEREAVGQCALMLEKMHMADPDLVLQRYPHQLSGGQQQRVLIAMALLTNPSLLIMDEPTTGLDVTVEVTVLDLIAELRREFGAAILYISHNLGVIARICHRVGVMYAGELVETAKVNDLYLNALHPYTRALISCVPKLGAIKASSQLHPIPGQVPPLGTLSPGCVFEPRCSFASEECRRCRPAFQEVIPDHQVRCHRWQEVISRRRHEETASTVTLSVKRSSQPLLTVRRMKMYYPLGDSIWARLIRGKKQRYVKAVDDLSFELHPGQTLGIVGESGCGKTTLAKCIVGLEVPTSGNIEFRGSSISRGISKRSRQLLRELQMVFQNPESTLNPAHSVGYAIGRPLRILGTMSHREVQQEVRRLLQAVKLDGNYFERKPNQLSGGEKQRVAIARAFAENPRLVLCDEPVSSLDVSVQASVLNLLLEFQKRWGTAFVFISHDLSVVRYVSDYIAVMYLGQLCEIGPTESLFSPPYHPYTEALLSAVPTVDPTVTRKRIRLVGTVPSPINPPPGCRFQTRCPRKLGSICETQCPPEQELEGRHQIYCHIPIGELNPPWP